MDSYNSREDLASMGAATGFSANPSGGFAVGGDATMRADEDDLIRAIHAVERQLMTLRTNADKGGMDFDEVEGQWQEEALAGAEQSDGGLTNSRLLVVANRLPSSVFVDAAGAVTTKSSSGGLVSALRSLRNYEMLWIGWPGADVRDPVVQARARELLREEAVPSLPVFLSNDLLDLYYNGYSNNVLWPLFHYIPLPTASLPYIAEQFRAYTEANERFAEAVLAEYKEGDTVWVQDYHLMLVPALLRRARPNIRVAFFLHTPFPSSEIYRVLPNRREILEGVLQSNLVGFQTHGYARNFASACTRILGAHAQMDGISHGNWYACMGAFPIGIDPDRFTRACRSDPAVLENKQAFEEAFRGRKILLGIDRLDYIKGIPHRLYAFGRFLEQNPSWINKVVLIQIAVPSRTHVHEYQRLKRTVHELVGRVNARFGSPTFLPVLYLDRSIDFDEMCALYMMADVMVVSSLRDGMNLVAYEYVACQEERHGVLVLSEFAGAAGSLGAGSIQVNPWDVHELAGTIKYALSMDASERREFHRYAFQHVVAHTAQHWAASFLHALRAPSERQAERRAEQAHRRNWCDNQPRRDMRAAAEATVRAEGGSGGAAAAALAVAREFGAVDEFSEAQPLDVEAVIKAFRASRHRLIITGLTGVTTKSAAAESGAGDAFAKVGGKLSTSVNRLAADPKTMYVVLTSRTRHQCDSMMGKTAAWLGAENGFFLRHGASMAGASSGEKDWEILHENSDLSWKEGVLRVLEYFTARTPRSYIKKAETHLSWHYKFCAKGTASRQLKNLRLHLNGGLLSNTSTEVIDDPEMKMIQIRPLNSSKGVGLEHIMEFVANVDRQGGPDVHRITRKAKPVDFVLCIGSFLKRDEDVFSKLRASQIESLQGGVCVCGRSVSATEAAESLLVNEARAGRFWASAASAGISRAPPVRPPPLSAAPAQTQGRPPSAPAVDEAAAPAAATAPAPPAKGRKGKKKKQQGGDEGGANAPAAYYFGTNIPFAHPSQVQRALAERMKPVRMMQEQQQLQQLLQGRTAAALRTVSGGSDDPSIAASAGSGGSGADSSDAARHSDSRPSSAAGDVSASGDGDGGAGPFADAAARQAEIERIVKGSEARDGTDIIDDLGTKRGYMTCLKCLRSRNHLVTCTIEKHESTAESYVDSLQDVHALLSRLADIVDEEREQEAAARDGASLPAAAAAAAPAESGGASQTAPGGLQRSLASYSDFKSIGNWHSLNDDEALYEQNDHDVLENGLLW